VSYSAPVITSVSGCSSTANPKKTADCAQAGGTTITIQVGACRLFHLTLALLCSAAHLQTVALVVQGTNFGASGATVLIGSNTVTL
jgi:hypothetical protein